MTLKGQTRDPIMLRVQYLENLRWAREFKFDRRLCIGNAEEAHK